MRVIRSVVAFVLALSLVVADFLQAGVTMAAAPVAAPARPSGDPAPVTPAPAPAAVVPDPTMAEVSTAGPTVFTTRLRLKTDTTWGPQGSPYVLQAGMLVDLDASLTLLPGTVVQVGAGESIVVSGQLLSLGRPDARVTITSAGAERFSAVSFQRSLLDSVRKRVSVLDYTDVSHGTGGSGVLLCTHSGMVDVRAPVYISNSSFTDSSTTALSMDQGAVTRSRFATSACGIGGARATVSVGNNHGDASLRRAASFAVSGSVRMEYNTFESMVNFHSDPTGVYFRNNTVLQDTWLNPVLGAGDGAYAGNWWGRPLKAEPWCMPLAEYDAWKLRPKPDLRGPCPSSPGMYLVGYPASYLPALSAPPPPAPEAVLDTLAPRLGPVMSATGALVLAQEVVSLSDAGRQLVVARRYRSDRAALGRLATRTSGTAVDRLGYLGTDHRPGSYAAAGRPARPVDIVQAPGLGPVGYADASTAQQAFANPHGDVVRVVSDASSGQKHLTAAYDSFGVPTSVSGTTALVPLGYQGGGGVGGAVYGALTCNGDQACMMREVATGAASGVAFHGLGKLLSPVTGALGGALSRRAGQVLGVGKRAAASRLSRSAAREGAESVGESAAREATQRATRSAVREGADAVEQRSARKTLEACSPNSFAAGTPVAMADGSSKPIEQVQVGDRVAAQDPSSGDESAQTVTAVPRTTAERDLYTVTTSDGHQVVATDQHPFWDVTDRRWVYTRDLTVGHELDTPSGTVTITRIEHRRQLLTAYNLSVDGPHTYRAGDSRILVHNCPSGDHGGRTFTSSDPYVADLANAIERAYPGHVVDVNRVVYGLDGKQLTDYDIVLKNAIIQVKKNSRGKGVTRQVITSMESSGLPVIGYSPGLGRHARRSIEKAGGLAVGSLDDLIELVKPDKVVRS